VRAWVGDVGNGRLLRLTPDGRDVLVSRAGLGEPFGIAVAPGSSSVWVADHLSRNVEIIDPQNLSGPVISGIPDPFNIALDPIDQSGWVCDLAGGVRHYNPDGTPGLPSAISVLLLDPTGIATDPKNGDVWVAENNGNRIRRFARAGTPIAARSLQLPSRVAVDSLTGEAWVTSAAAGWIWRLSPAVAVLDSLQLAEPIGIALDWRRRTAWIADDVLNALVAVDMNTRTERFRVTGLSGALDVAVDLATGEAWVVARGAGSVSRISPAGALLARVTGLGDPYEVRLDPGQ
jgi:DNA-binding beta-propeller fold protein YncE